MLDKEFQYFIDNQESLVKKYRGKVLLIIGEKVVDVYQNFVEAYSEAIKKYKPGTFMLQNCDPGEDAYTVTITSSIAIQARV